MPARHEFEARMTSDDETRLLTYRAGMDTRVPRHSPSRIPFLSLPLLCSTGVSLSLTQDGRSMGRVVLVPLLIDAKHGISCNPIKTKTDILQQTRFRCNIVCTVHHMRARLTLLAMPIKLCVIHTFGEKNAIRISLSTLSRGVPRQGRRCPGEACKGGKSLAPPPPARVPLSPMPTQCY